MQGIMQGTIQELEHEAVSTRKMLERIPEDKFDYKPHEKSYSLRGLASHIVDGVEWGIPTLTEDVFVMDMEAWKPYAASDKEDLLATWDKNLAALIECMKNTPDEKLFVNWTMKDKKSGKTFMTMPRIAVLRAFIISHMIHHRGQLSVYLRMVDAPLPQVYGPTADEPEMMMMD